MNIWNTNITKQEIKFKFDCSIFLNCIIKLQFGTRHLFIGVYFNLELLISFRICFSSAGSRLRLDRHQVRSLLSIWFICSCDFWSAIRVENWLFVDGIKLVSLNLVYFSMSNFYLIYDKFELSKMLPQQNKNTWAE